MARKRTIDPDSWTDDKLADLDIGAHLLWVGLVSLADDEGRIKWSASQFKMRIFPSKEGVTIAMISDWMEQLAAPRGDNRRSLLEVYTVGQSTFAHHPNWHKSQYVNKPSPSKLPEPSATVPLLVADKSGNDTGTIRDKKVPSVSVSVFGIGELTDRERSVNDLRSKALAYVAVPSSGPELRDFALLFLAAFGNCFDAVKADRHVGAYAATLAGMAKIGATPARAWDACAEARRQNGGVPLFGARLKQAFNFLPSRSRVEEPNASDKLQRLCDLPDDGSELPPNPLDEIRSKFGIVVPRD